MNTNVVTLKVNNNIIEACELMKSKDIGSILITDNTRLKGIVTDRDIVLALANRKILTTKLGDFMSRNIIAVDVDDDESKIVKVMKEFQIRRVPVIEHDYKLKGIVSLGDLSKHNITNDRAGKTLTEISMNYKSINNDVSVEDFPL